MRQSNFVKDITGRRSGLLTAVSFAYVKGRNAHWLCLCDCGESKVISSSSLVQGATKSCGCLRAKAAKGRAVHGEAAKTKEYRAWMDIKARCFNVNTLSYHNYGARGITICERWRSSYLNFLNDVGRAPSKKYSIERIDNDGNYEPGNVRWATKKEQLNNKRDNRQVTYNGKTQTVAQWCEELGLGSKRTRDRLSRGLSLDKVFNRSRLIAVPVKRETK